MYKSGWLTAPIHLCIVFFEAGVQVRLVDGPHSGAGRVEVFHNKAWGSICDSLWDDQDATVVCRMLVTYPLDR